MSDETPSSVRWRRTLRNALILVGFFYLAYLGVLTYFQRKILYPGVDMPPPRHASLPAGAERIWVDIENGGRVEGWFLPGDGVSAENPGPAVMLAHGNGEFIENWADGVDGYLDRGVSVLLPEYRGYGRSDGEPTQKNITRDFVEFHDRLADRPDVDGDRIVYHGFSLGGATLTSLARERKPKALILQSTFTRVKDMVAVPVPDALVADPYETIEVVSELDVPMLVVHGKSDRVVPYEQGERLAQAAGTELLSHGGGHHQMMERREYWSAVEELLVRADVLEPGA